MAFPLVANNLSYPPAAYHHWQSGNTTDTLMETWNPPNVYKTSQYTGGGPAAIGDYVAANCSSLHPGGVNVAFADGSVHFVKETISCWQFTPGNDPAGCIYNYPAWSFLPGAQIGTWQKLSTRGFNDVVSSDAY